MASQEPDLRTERVVIYMTREDADELFRLARDLRFKSRSAFVVAILERLIMGGFSVGSFFRVGAQIQRRAESTMPDQIEFDWNALKTALRPLPALPPEEDPATEREVRNLVREIREEILAK